MTTTKPSPSDDPRVPEPPEDEFTYEECVGWVYGYQAALDAVEALATEGETSS